MSSFDDLRQFVKSIESTEDAKAKLVPAVAKISKINELFLEISEKRNSILANVNSISSEVHNKHREIDALISTCENSAHEIIENQEKQQKRVDFRNVKFSMPLEDFLKESKLTEEERNQMNETTLMKKQMEFEMSKINELKQQYQQEVTRSNELKRKLYAASRLYAPILMKLRELEEVVDNFKKAHLL